MMLSAEITQDELNKLSELYPELSTDQAYHRVLQHSLYNNSYRKKGACNVLNFNRRRSDFVSQYRLYEQQKKALIDQNLDPEEYEIQVMKLAESLGI